MQQPLAQLASKIAATLQHQKLKVVFAESCTAGLISATLARVPGVSNVHCGSAVVYRLDTKTQWLGVPAAMLEEFGAVSEPVASSMAEGVLAKTPEANLALSITGHLGPGAPSEQDGQIYIGIARHGQMTQVFGVRLPRYGDPMRFIYPGESEREQRQWAAVESSLNLLAETLTVAATNPGQSL